MVGVFQIDQKQKTEETIEEKSAKVNNRGKRDEFFGLGDDSIPLGID